MRRILIAIAAIVMMCSPSMSATLDDLIKLLQERQDLIGGVIEGEASFIVKYDKDHTLFFLSDGDSFSGLLFRSDDPKCGGTRPVRIEYPAGSYYYKWCDRKPPRPRGAYLDIYKYVNGGIAYWKTTEFKCNQLPSNVRRRIPSC